MTKKDIGKIDYRELIKSEYKKCALDPIYFISKYCHIQHPIRGRMLFGLYPYQVKAINIFEEDENIIVLKARQLGFSTAIACYSLWLCLFQSDKTVLIIATKQETAKNLVTKFKFAFDHLPPWLQQKCTEDNKLTIKLKNGSQIKAVSSSSDAGRSEAVSLLVLDEAAFIDNAETIWISAQATLATGGRSIVLSSPNGFGNFFHQTWEKATASENNFKYIKLTWRDHPERDDNWRDEELEILGPRGFAQEHEAEFIGSGNSVIDAEIIMEMKAAWEKEPKLRTGFDGNLWVWEEPIPGKQYIICADVARGDGEDFSTFHVINALDMVQVAEYKGKVDTETFSNMLVGSAHTYNKALLIVENAQQGWAVLQKIIYAGYPNIFYMSEDVRILDDNKTITKWNQYEKKKVAGFTTSVRTRPLIISKLEEYCRTKSIVIQSGRMLNELLTFIWNGGKAEAQTGYNDDLTMALAVGLWVRDTSMKIITQSSDLSVASIEGIKTSKYDGIIMPSHMPQDPYIMPMGNPSGNPMGAPQVGEDLRWLL